MTRHEERVCGKCGGEGVVACIICNGTGYDKMGNKCNECKGELYTECLVCEGSGRTTKSRGMGGKK